ncbi:FmdB family zinc ribbon protein [Microbacterium esteraromaticum]|uniref:FmdB family zinc ribbon protein n=1 Tax=Microbacterium esteraromaticum TaxID=57043 RepID=UPI0019572035|nr:FmdB family zinc ribbon protein [Microbacterium esteraromaticum]MBM7465189.1 putative FmdB family regulatory protein [Microbacterium esteraromaticum]
MPTYAYACTACDHRFDAVQSFTEDSLTLCPECGGALRKQYGSVGVTFNGSGFYRTDSRGNTGAASTSSASSKAESSTSANPAPAKAPASN